MTTGSPSAATGTPGSRSSSRSNHRPPTWPDNAVPQQFHFDFGVEDLDAADAYAESDRCSTDRGTRRSRDSFRVYLDPSGHPFCLHR